MSIGVRYNHEALKRIEELEIKLAASERTSTTLREAVIYAENRIEELKALVYADDGEKWNVKYAMEVAENQRLLEKLNSQADHGYWPSGAEIMPADKEWLRGGR